MSSGNGKIVVGVDGSTNSLGALRWALDEARLRGAKLVAVNAWHYPYVGTAWAAMSIDPEELRSAAAQILDEAIATSTAGDADGAPIERLVLQGTAASALIDAAQDADLLVVGSRGLGGFRGLLLGSVSTQIVQHAPCPVAVIPAEDE